MPNFLNIESIVVCCCLLFTLYWTGAIFVSSRLLCLSMEHPLFHVHVHQYLWKLFLGPFIIVAWMIVAANLISISMDLFHTWNYRAKPHIMSIEINTVIIKKIKLIYKIYKYTNIRIPVAYKMHFNYKIKLIYKIYRYTNPCSI